MDTERKLFRIFKSFRLDLPDIDIDEDDIPDITWKDLKSVKGVKDEHIIKRVAYIKDVKYDIFREAQEYYKPVLEVYELIWEKESDYQRRLASEEAAEKAEYERLKLKYETK